jgi:hypothetical protein
MVPVCGEGAASGGAAVAAVLWHEDFGSTPEGPLWRVVRQNLFHLRYLEQQTTISKR